jgi:Tfp pilus assembly protein PilO
MDKRKQKLLIIGAIVLFLGLLYRFFPEFSEIMPGSSEIGIKQGQLIQYQKQLARLEGIKGRINEMEKDLDRIESQLFTGDTPSLAAAEIQKMLNEISEKNGASIDSIEVMAVKSIEGIPYVEIPVRFVVLARIDELKRILYDIESHDRYLAIKEATVKPRRVSKGDDGVYAVFTVAGLMKEKS